MADIIIAGKKYGGVNVLRAFTEAQEPADYIEMGFVGDQVVSGTITTLPAGQTASAVLNFRPDLVLLKFKSHPTIQQCNSFAAALDPYKADPDSVRTDYTSAGGAASLLDVNVYPYPEGFGLAAWDEGNGWAQVEGLELEYIAVKMNKA